MKVRSLLFSFVVLVAGFLTSTTFSTLFAGVPGSVKPSTDRIQKIRANQNNGQIDARDVVNAQSQVTRLANRKSMLADNLNWSQLGPNNASGQTLSLLYTNKDVNGATILTGGVSGGIWKSRNNGLTWHQIDTQGTEVLRLSSMIQTHAGTVYAGTGSLTNVGTGLYRSDDDSTFNLVPGTQPVANSTTADWARILKLAVYDPTGRIFAATNTGLKYSDDGMNWTIAKAGFAYSVEVGPDGTILANIDNLAYVANAAGSGVPDLVLISTGTSTTLPASGVSGIAFAFAPSDANVMYASLSNTSGGLLNAYKSEDKGLTWTVVFPGNNTYNPLGANGQFSNSIVVYPDNPNEILLGGVTVWHGEKVLSSGYYNWEQVSQLGVQEEIFAMSDLYTPPFIHQILFRPALTSQFAIATDDGISIGTISSSGISFQHLIRNYNVSRLNSISSSVRNDAAFGGAVLIGAELVPGDNILNDPKNGIQINPGFGGDVAWSMIQPTCIFFGTGTAALPFIRSEDLGVTASPTFLGETTSGGPINSGTDGAFVPISYWESFDFRQSVDSIQYIAKAGPVKADSVLILNSANEKFPVRYVVPQEIPQNDTVMVQDPIQTRFFIQGNKNSVNGIYMTKEALQFNKDPQWFRIANTNGIDQITCYAVSKDLGVMWAGTSKGILFRLTNIAMANDSSTANVDSSTCVIGHSYYDSTIYDQFRGRMITSLAIGADNQTVMVTLGNYGNTNYIYKSTNGLDSIPTFTSVQGNLPPMPVYSGTFEMTNSNTVILGTDFGVFTTDNIQAVSPDWAPQYTGCGNVPVTSIKQQSNPGLYYYRPDNYGYLFMGSYGRGMFTDQTYSVVLGTNDITPKQVAENHLKVQPNPFNSLVTISAKLSGPTPVRVLAFDLSGRQVYSASFGIQTAGDFSKPLNLGSLPRGTYIIKMETNTGACFGKAMKIN